MAFVILFFFFTMVLMLFLGWAYHNAVIRGMNEEIYHFKQQNKIWKEMAQKAISICGDKWTKENLENLENLEKLDNYAQH